MPHINKKLSAFVAPPKPDTAAILELHRSNDGYITFHRKRSDNWEDLVAIPADELGEWFPEFVQVLEVDSYYSINAFYKPKSQKSAVPGLYLPLRQKRHLRWLTACFADLDCGRQGTPSEGHTIGAVMHLQDKGIIPNVSMFVRSGRGVWPFWILRNENPEHGPIDGPIRAWPESVNAWARVQSEIGSRLSTLWADANARDAVRVTRIPGSLHSKVQRRVAYVFQADSNGEPFTYTLSQLCKFFNIIEPRLNPAIRDDVDPAVSAVKRKGFQGRFQKALFQFEMLRSLRGGGFRKGVRYTSCHLLACILKTLKKTEDKIRTAVFELGCAGLSADGAHPLPLENEDILAAINAAHSINKMANQTISDRLKITPAESDCLESWPAASHFRGITQNQNQDFSASSSERRKKRRDFIREYILQGNPVPTFRNMVDILESQGMSAALETVKRDYEALGVQNPRKRNPQKGKNLNEQESLFPPTE